MQQPGPVFSNDTIVALSTPPGEGAIGIIRLSGPRAIAIADGIFHGRNLTRVEGHTVHYGKIKTVEGEVIDECMATVFRAPRSYTREDVVEFSCHGSPYILRKVLQMLTEGGARMARPGEFTLRAFLHGQLDLSQAEAVADLIASESQAGHLLAMKQMRGGFSGKIKNLRRELIDFASLLELELDFGEEDVEFADRAKMHSLISSIQKEIDSLLESFYLGNVIKQGVPTVIAGRPNAGKSTLLNALLNEERAIISDIPGTTRDTIEEFISIRGIRFRLIDTAGIRSTDNEIEKQGVDRTIREISSAMVTIYLFDVATTEPGQLQKDVKQYLVSEKSAGPGQQVLFAANKMDLNPYVKPEMYYTDHLIGPDNLITLSAKNRMNIDDLKDKLYEMVIGDRSLGDRTIVTNSRHVDVLQKAREALEQANTGIASERTGDLIALDIRQALHHLGEITGEISTDDLLDSIFSRFCIGK